MAANKRHHGGPFNILILATVGPIIEVLVIHMSRCEYIVDHSMIENEIRLTIDYIRPDISIDSTVLIGIVLHRLASPTHGRIAIE